MSTNPGQLVVAAAQYPLDALPGFDAWTAKAARWVADGAATGARLLVFPEYGAVEIAAAVGGAAVCGDLKKTLAAVADHAEATSAVWSRLSALHHVFILAPSGPERRADGYVNAARLIGPNGGVGVQEKLILTPFERDWGMRPGTGQRVFDTPIGCVGIAICYDCEFPLLVRALSEAGAEIILVPSCTEHLSGFLRVRMSAMARALESQIATVMSPTIGDALWSPAVDRNTGSAGIFVPPDIALTAGGVVREGVLNRDGWIVGSIDLVGLSRLRDTGEMRNWRDWSRQQGAAPLGRTVQLVSLT